MNTLEVIERFNDAFNSGDVDAIMALMTDDGVFESTTPAPDGRRFEGADAVRKVWLRLFEKTKSPHFDWEESPPSATGQLCGGRSPGTTTTAAVGTYAGWISSECGTARSRKSCHTSRADHRPPAAAAAQRVSPHGAEVNRPLVNDPAGVTARRAARRAPRTQGQARAGGRP